jgi:hypothetical protein
MMVKKWFHVVDLLAKPNGNCEYEEVEVKADDLEVDEAPPIPLLVANILKV